jgi:hypothetical protein
MSSTRRRSSSSRLRVEWLEGRALLSNDLAPVLHEALPGRSSGAAEVSALHATTDSTLRSVAAAFPLALSLSSADYSQGYSVILSPSVPITRSDGHTTDSVIWGRDITGNVVLDDPVAVGYKASSNLLYGYQLSRQFTDGVLIDYTTRFTRTDGRVFAGASGETTNTQGVLSIPLPGEVGQYTLMVTFRVNRSKDAITDQRVHTVYELLNTPLTTSTAALSVSVSHTGEVNPVFWTEDAIRIVARWATGRKREAGVLTALNQAIYSNKRSIKYGSQQQIEIGLQQYRMASLYDYLKGTVKEADCYNLADMLSTAAALQGIPVGMTIYRGTGLVAGDHPPLSGVHPDNRVPNVLDLKTGQYDAWYNGGHVTPTYSGKYYDPTHGFIGTYSAADESNPDGNWGANLLAYVGPQISSTSSTRYLMKNGQTVGLLYSLSGSTTYGYAI